MWWWWCCCRRSACDDEDEEAAEDEDGEEEETEPGKGRSALASRLQQRLARLRTRSEGNPESSSCWMAPGDCEAAARVASCDSDRAGGERACFESSVRPPPPCDAELVAAAAASCCFLPSSVRERRWRVWDWAAGAGTTPIQDMRREK